MLIEYESAIDGPDAGRRLVDVVGDWDEPFVLALTRAVGRTRGVWQVYRTGPQNEGSVWRLVDAEVTVRAVATATDGRVLPIDTFGRGPGRPDDLLHASVSDLLPFLRYVTPVRLRLEAIKYARQRTLARDWMDAGGGIPTMELLQAVSVEREWLRGTFDVVFGLDPEPGGRLLREVGYRKVNNSPDTWVDQRE
ncbi:hypothetical protein [Microbacterium sp. Bi128]|uniref:hypothetical protein n=1 Tax=Microbacterium sp. Bi128 TaxID=2821115 RepID=UPI001D2F124A|nr:hypothetical protein [Microbacterium sp. Bi128]CAH0327433.1 hypothetical protein SRABI128_06100 [Microbacterium sp. Bi128]